jgi:hypothetical protein
MRMCVYVTCSLRGGGCHLTPNCHQIDYTDRMDPTRKKFPPIKFNIKN